MKKNRLLPTAVSLFNAVDLTLAGTVYIAKNSSEKSVGLRENTTEAGYCCAFPEHSTAAIKKKIKIAESNNELNRNRHLPQNTRHNHSDHIICNFKQSLDIDMTKETKYFYKKFFSLDLNTRDADRILEGKGMRLPKKRRKS